MGPSQADPQFRTKLLCTHLRSAEVRRQLIAQKDYGDELPSAETVMAKLNKLCYYPKKWPRVNPQKLPETDGIFARVNQNNEEAYAVRAMLRLSMDTKAIVKVGSFTRGNLAKTVWLFQPFDESN
jgi:hypothetical protein